MSGQPDQQLSRVRHVFDDWARAGRADDMARSHEPFALQGFARLALPRDGWYLDIGCGIGYTVRWAAEALPEGKAIGLDTSGAMIARARQLSTDFPNTEFHVAAFPQHPLPQGQLDAVFSMEVLYYLPDLNAALGEIVRLLKPAGHVVSMVDYYGENRASHSWPDDVGVAMTLLDADGWRRAFTDAGLHVLHQDRVRISPEDGAQSWKVTEGSLLTLAERA